MTGMVIEAALRQARDSLFQGGQADVDWVDAIREMAERSLDSVTEPSRRDRFRIGIHLDTDGSACDAHGWTLPDAIRRHITCDGLLSPTFVHAGIPISVGRTQRMIPERTRRIVLLRDQGCGVPGCQQTHCIEIHHIIHWEDGGPTDTVESDRTLPAPPPPAPQGRTRDHRQRRRTRRHVLHEPTRSPDRDERGETHAPRGTTAHPARGVPTPCR